MFLCYHCSETRASHLSSKAKKSQRRSLLRKGPIWVGFWTGTHHCCTWKLREVQHNHAWIISQTVSAFPLDVWQGAKTHSWFRKKPLPMTTPHSDGVEGIYILRSSKGWSAGTAERPFLDGKLQTLPESLQEQITSNCQGRRQKVYSLCCFWDLWDTV